MLAKEKPGNRRQRAARSVIVDRIVGLYVLFLVAALGVFITGLGTVPIRWCMGFASRCWGYRRLHGRDRTDPDSRLSRKLARWRQGDARIPKVGHAIKSLFGCDQDLSRQAGGTVLGVFGNDSRAFLADGFNFLPGVGAAL